MKTLFSLIALVLAFVASAGHVQETIRLNKGWNAIYLESTPDDSDCERFFSGELASVIRVGAYCPNAYSDTSQYDSEGKVRQQKPVSYEVWSRVAGESSTFTTLAGGNCYLVYATAPCTKTFYGVPAQPNLVWRVASSSEGLLNFVAPSIPAGTSVGVKTYFAEGPSGDSPTAYQIAGQGSAPSLLPLGVLSKAKLEAGRAYAMTATRADDWPGVIRVTGLAGGVVSFGSTATKVSFVLANRGATERTFRLTLRASEKSADQPLKLSRSVRESAFSECVWSNLAYGASWDVKLSGETSQEITLGLDRTEVTDASAVYGCLLEVSDLGGTTMRVRLPVAATVPVCAEDVSPQAGLWVGAVALDEVSPLNDPNPLPAKGTLKLTALAHVDKYGRPTLLPRIALAYGADTNTVGVTLYRELEDIPADAASKRRLTGLLLPTSVAGAQDPDENHLWDAWTSTFTYVIDAQAADNPFRHAWHPDHDGLSADYTAYNASECWPITNVVSFAWQKQDGTRHYPHTADGLSAGVVTWTVTGLAKNPLVARGIFSFKKVLGNSKIEKGTNE